MPEHHPPADAPAEQQEKFRGLLAKFDTVVLVSRGVTGADAGAADGSGLDARPMAVARMDANCDLWFLTGADTAKVRELAADPRVQVIGQSGRERCVSLSGTARVVEDRAMARELWNELDRVWFPDGPDDPNLRIIHVRAEGGEYWDTAGVNGVKFVLQAAKAYVTRERPDTEDRDQYGAVKL